MLSEYEAYLLDKLIAVLNMPLTMSYLQAGIYKAILHWLLLNLSKKITHS